MPYVIVRTQDGAYVACSGSLHSYTRKLTQAATYTTREAAAANACANEHVLDVAALLSSPEA